VESSSAANEILIDRTVELWQRRGWRDLSREDARQIVENVTGFFAVLAEWSRAEMPTAGNTTVDSSGTGSSGGASNDR
jgi:hypothetical protein